MAFKTTKTSGFTLIELMVSMIVFLLVIGATTSIFISIVRHQRQILAEQQLLNQISYVEEHVAKALRMAKKSETEEDSLCIPAGYIYMLTRPEDDGFCRGIKFINQSDGNACQEIYLDNFVNNNLDEPLVLKELKNSSDENDSLLLTPTNIEIDYVRFGINGGNGCCGEENCLSEAKEGDLDQPRVTFLIGIKMNATGSGDQEKIIQTTVSQRNVNIIPELEQAEPPMLP